MRPVDADELKSMKFSCGMHDDDHVMYVPIREVMKNIDKAPTVGGWISVKDRLPEDEYECLVVNEGKWIWIGWFHGSEEEWIVDGESCANGYVTHWMAIPDLPKEEERE